MKIDIIVVYVPRYERGHEKNFVPSITGIHLAALTPPGFEVRVYYQQVQPVDYATDADLVALSFFSGFAVEAFKIADRFRAMGKKVVGGGPHATFMPEECLEHFDSIVVGEAEVVWERVLYDARKGNLKRRYTGMISTMENLPMPRYDLLPPNFFIPRVVQTTRGCYFKCSFCSVPSINPGFRTRPVEDVIRNISYNSFRHWWQRKLVWFWDDNPAADRAYFKELLRAMVPLNKWWLTQASIDIVKDDELMDLMRDSGCIGIFLGIESFGAHALKEMKKHHNKVHQYREAIKKLHRIGVCVMAGFIAGFDHDTPETIIAMADQLYDIGVDVPFLSVLTPFKGTPLYDELEKHNRLLHERGWEFYNGYNVVFRPRNMASTELKNAHTTLWKKSFSVKHVIKRSLRSFRHLRAGAIMMSLMMNGFYGLKALRNNCPVDMSSRCEKDQEHMPESGPLAFRTR